MIFRPLLFALIVTTCVIPTLAFDGQFVKLTQEPLIRIGLSTNSSSVSITTSDSQLVAFSPDEPGKYLETSRILVAARSYRPPEVEQYRFEIQNIVTAAEADEIAKDIREATEETAIVSVDTATNTWKVWIGGTKVMISTDTTSGRPSGWRRLSTISPRLMKAIE